MKKQQRQMLLLLVLLAVVTAGFFGLKQYNKVQSQLPEEDSITIVDMNRDDIVKFSYDYEGETYNFVKEEDTWYYADDKSLKLDQNSIELKTIKVCPLTAEQVIENVTDMTRYGLDEPSKTLQFETATESVILYVGDYNSISKVYYVCKPSESTVYTVLSPNVTVFNYALEDLVEEETEEIAEAAVESSVAQ